MHEQIKSELTTELNSLKDQVKNWYDRTPSRPAAIAIRWYIL